jgi:elongation factor 1-alpha
MCLFYFFL